MSIKVPGAVLLPVGVQVRSQGSVVRRRVGCSQSGSRLQEVQSGFGLQVSGWRLVLEGRVIRRRHLWLSRGIRLVGQGFGQMGRVVIALRVRVSAVSRSFKPQSLKLWSARKVKVETVKDQSSHSIKANHRGPGSRLKVKAIKSKLIQDCQSELQELRSTFKRPTRAAVDVQEAHKSRGQHSRGPQEPRSTFKRPTRARSMFKRPTRAPVNVQEAHKLQEGHACKKRVEAVAIGPAGGLSFQYVLFKYMYSSVL
ncbi:hypothetical protein B0F90DRAFT_1816940 [Multifurca ochricompacta]|uniref:Uncharacterized protein n=1 Tax=Multifurca ochricompacta TaxID=376703 RepID=A0AAD4M4G8_9AGAM|nr:hypothetical protein B0F90DRAFT_1816940 [Multifurca ochricompacta]